MILLEDCHCIFSCFNGQICSNVYLFRAYVAMMYLYQHTNTYAYAHLHMCYTRIKYTCIHTHSKCTDCLSCFLLFLQMYTEDIEDCSFSLVN